MPLAPNDFVHLHTHSEFSLLDGLGRITDLVDTAEAHGAPLGDEEIKQTKANYGWPENEQFLVPDEVAAHAARQWREYPDAARLHMDALMAILDEESPDYAK